MLKMRITKRAWLFLTLCVAALLVFAGCSGSSTASNNPGGSGNYGNGGGGSGNGNGSSDGSGNGSGGGDGSGGTPVQQAGPFTISNLQLPVETITEGQQVTIFVDVVNDDSCEGSQSITIYVENSYEVCLMEQEQTVSLDADEKRTVGFTFTFDEYDIYYIKAGETRQELRVYPLGPISGEHGDGPFCSECH